MQLDITIDHDTEEISILLDYSTNLSVDFSDPDEPLFKGFAKLKDADLENKLKEVAILLSQV